MINAREKLQFLQRSLAAQIGLSGQSEREAQVEGFKNRMEALASPGVVQSFTTGDIGKYMQKTLYKICIFFTVYLRYRKIKKTC